MRACAWRARLRHGPTRRRQILEEHRRNCERQGKYVEAEIARSRLEELRNHEERRRRDALKARQHAERVGVEEAHELEFQEVNALWDRKMEEYRANARALMEQLREKQMGQLADVRQQFEEQVVKPKFSRELLNLRRIEQSLARAKEYAEAHKVKQKADQMESFEMEKMQGQQISRLEARELKLKQKFDVERSALQKRIQSGTDLQKKQREQDIKRLLLRFKNLKNDLIAQQNMEKSRLEKALAASRARANKGIAQAPVSTGMDTTLTETGRKVDMAAATFGPGSPTFGKGKSGKGRSKGKGKGKGKGKRRQTPTSSVSLPAATPGKSRGGAGASPYGRAPGSGPLRTSASDAARVSSLLE